MKVMTMQAELKAIRSNGLPAQAELTGHPEVEQCVQQFDQRIAPGDGFAAFPALAAQQQETQDRYVVVGPDGLPAAGAVGRRGDDGQPSGKAHDDHVQETADEKAEG